MTRVIVYDAAEQSPVGLSWSLGARCARLAGLFDVVLATGSWGSALGALADMPAGTVSEIQVWGHGKPGHPMIDGISLASSPPSAIANAARCLDDGSLVWFRSCSVFAGERGHRFARWAASLFGCRVAASTYKIGFPLHSGCHSLMPGNHPSWPLKEGYSDDGQRLLSSGPFRPNTLPFSAMRLPEAW